MKRRHFVQLIAGGLLVHSTGKSWSAAMGTAEQAATNVRLNGTRKLESFDYEGVRLLPGPFADRLALTREFYLSIPDDDTLKGFREAAGLPAPGQHLGGWCDKGSSLLFGQWLSGMARLYRATGDTQIRDKARRLLAGWGEASTKMSYGHYGFEKFVCGLVDMARYGDAPEALPLLSWLVHWGIKNLKRDRLNATDADSQGGFFNGQLEWYTLSENLYRAFLLTGDAKYREFAAVWHYPHYWGMFNGQVNETPDGFHGYSHANALNGAAMAYAVTGEKAYLDTIVGAHDYFQKTQCYATGGYGPGEKLMRPDGELGQSVAVEPNAQFLGGDAGRSFETPCGTWAVFKLGRSLQEFTGQARFGDWTERVLFNGIGAALPIKERGRTFYYADYRLGGGRKTYYGSAFPCCAGTYIQDVADIHNIIYLKNADGLFVNMYVPSQLKWNFGGQEITVTQTTLYPTEETTNFALQMSKAATFALHFRVPEWARSVSLQVNGRLQPTSPKADQWMSLQRKWKNGDRVTLHIELQARRVPIDEQHPDRFAWVRGPVVLVRPTNAPLPAANEPATQNMVPFYRVGEAQPYLMYFDPVFGDVPPVQTVLVPTSFQHGESWNYTTDKPADNWNVAGFKTDAWKSGTAPFGTMDIARTRWDTAEIWLRREVVIPDVPISTPFLVMFHDEDTEVYFNGVLATQVKAFNTSYQTMEISPVARTQIKPNAPLSIAVHVRQSAGSQLIDLGLVDLKPQKKGLVK